MNKKTLQKFTCNPDTKIVDALQLIDDNASGTLFVVDENLKLLGCITDGDIRRWLLKNGNVQDFVQSAMKKNPERTYSKFAQNMTEVPDAELDWVFKNVRAIFFFSVTNEDYYCITIFNEKNGTYESATGPLKGEYYKSVAEEVMQKVG